MTQDNVEIVRWLYEAVSSGLDPAPEPFDPTNELDARDVAQDFGVVRGFEASLDLCGRIGGRLRASTSRSKLEPWRCVFERRTTLPSRKAQT
jgi:hypothetical protein